MGYDRVMRGLRLRYDISCRELAECIQMSRQRVVQIEASPDRSTAYQLALMQKAFEKVIACRRAKADCLEADYLAVRDRLLEYEENCHA